VVEFLDCLRRSPHDEKDSTRRGPRDRALRHEQSPERSGAHNDKARGQSKNPREVVGKKTVPLLPHPRTEHVFAEHRQISGEERPAHLQLAESVLTQQSHADILQRAGRCASHQARLPCSHLRSHALRFLQPDACRPLTSGRASAIVRARLERRFHALLAAEQTRRLFPCWVPAVFASGAFHGAGGEGLPDDKGKRSRWILTFLYGGG